MNEELEKEKAVIKDCEAWFKFFTVLPKVATIIFAISVFITGIAVGASFDDGGMTFFIWLIGAVLCGLLYVILKLLLSYMVLHIYYLKGILRKAEQKEVKEEAVKEEISEANA
ncbi:MAG: hypothetical protein IJ996_01555 [Clostridia bacterium]|nr:hypothetical protein [Clostridia bacterium]